MFQKFKKINLYFQIRPSSRLRKTTEALPDHHAHTEEKRIIEERLPNYSRPILRTPGQRGDEVRSAIVTNRDFSAISTKAHGPESRKWCTTVHHVPREYRPSTNGCPTVHRSKMRTRLGWDLEEEQHSQANWNVNGVDCIVATCRYNSSKAAAGI